MTKYPFLWRLALFGFVTTFEDAWSFPASARIALTMASEASNILNEALEKKFVDGI